MADKKTPAETPRKSAGSGKKYRLKHVGVMSLAKIVAAIYGVFSALFAAILVLIALFTARWGLALIALAVLIGYPLMAFIMTAIATAVFNFASERIGPLELELESD